MATTTRLRNLPVQDLTLGQYNDVTPFQVPLGGCSASSNVVAVSGFLRSRPGFVRVYNPVPGRCHHMFVYQASDGTKNLCAISLNTTTQIAELYMYVGYSPVLKGTFLSGHVVESIPSTTCNFSAVSYIAPGNGPLYSFDGSTLALLSAASPPDYQPPVPLS